ncbi:MAG: c-type cytochrome [Planctomycetes bacterium]|nr:c-type cytochrome [Planctomycetota bacterium]
MEVKDMRELLIAFMLTVAFMAGGAQAIAEEAKKAGEHPVAEEAKKAGEHPVAKGEHPVAKEGAKSEAADPASYALTPEQFENCRHIYFDRCAGCHGVLRKGATGKALTPDKTIAKGPKKLRDFIWFGTGGGMPGWGKMGVITAEETDLLVKYIQNEPPIPPQWDMKDVRASWKLLIPPDKRPTKPEHNRDVDNMFAVVLRDAGQVAIIDGDTYEIVNTVNTGYAVHIVRMSMSGRYVYSIGRDGRATMIDLWMEKPDTVAEVRCSLDARSIEVSKFKGFEDKYAVVGGYWPPQFVILDGATLEPIKIVSTLSYTYDTGEFHPEPRVASIVASHFAPEWVLNIKETGQVWLVDYSDVNNPSIKMIEAERFLHDGGWDSTKRYFLVAANARNKIVVIDAKEKKLVAIIETGGIKPHPGRGANWIDPEFGPVWATGHIADSMVSVIGTDPVNHPEHAWKVVRKIKSLSSGNLFIKTHPNSKWVWLDTPLSKKEEYRTTIAIYDKANMEAGVFKTLKVADYGKAVHMEYNKAGDEVWVSIWGNLGDADKGKAGEIVIYDDKTLKVKHRIKNLITPTGKFNVYNTVRDIY